jgi:hypothetical protein
MESIAERQATSKGLHDDFRSNHFASSREFYGMDLSPTERRLVLISTLGLFLRRLRHGIAIRRIDLLRLLDFADSDVEAAS